MGKKPKAGSDPRQDRSQEKERAQGERFIEVAREIGVDESGREFDKALKKLTRSSRRS